MVAMKLKRITLMLVILIPQTQYAQTLPLKNLHAEPLYIDLIRDLGARKGERELNMGWKLNDNQGYREHAGFVEYEFSPVNRLGLELEVPFSYHYALKPGNTDVVPSPGIQCIKPALQYTFWVSGRYRLSMAAGTIYELRLKSFKAMADNSRWVKGNALNPFLIVAKRFGSQFHSLLYMGPVWERPLDASGDVSLQTNFSMHYILPSSGHFIGAELNQEKAAGLCRTVLRPQVKLRFSNTVALGFVTGIPLRNTDQNLDFMLRLIYEPQKK